MKALTRFSGPSVILASIWLGAVALAEEPRKLLPPVADFFRNPQVKTVELSPDGEHFALLISLDSRMQLAVGPSNAPAQLKIIKGFKDADLRSVDWVNNERLVFTITGPVDADNAAKFYAAGLFAINRDGTNYRELASAEKTGDFTTGTNIKSTVLTRNYTLQGYVHDGSNDVIVGEYNRRNDVERVYDSLRLYRLDTLNAKIVPLLRTQPPGVMTWLLDSARNPRIATSWHEGRRTIYYREAGSDAWEVIGDFNALNGEGFAPVFFGEDGTLYVTQASNAEANRLFRYDLVHRVVGTEPVYRADGFDFWGGFEDDPQAHKLVGLHFMADARSTVWFDPQFVSIQKKVDAALPATVNDITCGNCLSSKYVLVRSFSDRIPTRFILYEKDSGHMVQVGAQRPWIKPEQMGTQDFARFRARDGRMIPTYFTLPPGPRSGPSPTVILVHGGPWIRGGLWGWSAERQFLASRGYVVVEPEYRGSEGFGHDHYAAGFRQWGLAMQDDLADAAQWAIDKGFADPKRIAIAGASYGGYATLMGLIRNPELFRCGVEWAGVTDINLMFNVEWSDTTEEAKQYGMKALIGDPVADAARFKQISPLENAQRLKQPLLMAYGSDDQRVPMVHGLKFRDAVRKGNPNVEWIVYRDEGHGWTALKDNVDFWTRVETFLAKNLGDAP
jgi:dipeptidyl aminopeptidase/acylaminoacyl peptidase